MSDGPQNQSVRVLAPLLLAGGLGSLVFLLLWVIRGQAPVPWGVLEHVSVWCLGALVGLAGWGYVRRAGDVLERNRYLARTALLLVSAALSLAIGEWGVRRIVARELDAGSFERFKELKAKGEPIKVHSASPLATIITPSDDPNLVYELQPNLSMSFGDHQLATNEDGQRENLVYSKERTPGTVRILGLGDSGMFGWGVEQGDDYLNVAEKVLNARGGAPCEAINTGTPGYNTQLELELLKVRGLAFQPDIVVVGWCENDFFLPHFFLKTKKLPKNRSLLWDLLFHRDLFKVELQPGEIADRETAKNATGKVDMESVPDELKTGLYEEGVRKALAEMKTLSQERGFRLLVFGPLNSDILGIVQQLGIDHVNTLEKIKLTQYPAEWSVHAMHPRTEGHKVLGELLAQELDARGWLTPSPLPAPAGSTQP